MLELIIWQDKSGNQGSVVSPTILVHVFKFAATTQGDFHGLLVMRRREPLAPFGTAALQNQSAVLRRHAGAKAVRLSAAPVIRLEGSLGH